MTDDMPPDGRALTAAFDGDLLTEYVPDALGAADVRRRLALGRPLDDGALEPLHVGRLRVPLTRRAETVPVVSCAARARLLLLTEEALAGHAPRPEVFSYRSLGWEYRPAYQARQRHLRTLAARPELPLVLVLDVHRFGRSLPLATLRRAPWMTERLAGALTALHGAAGRSLLPGHRWSNRLATAALAPLDDTVAALAPGRWARWGDDLHIFVRDHAEADGIRAAVVTALQELGLRLSAEKSTVTAPAAVLAGPARVIDGHPAEVWRTGLAADDVTALRYALPRTPPDEAVSRTLVGAVRDRPVLLPRAVHYLDLAAGTAAGRAAAQELLRTAAADAFTAARVLALAGRHPDLAAEVPDALLAVAYDSGFVPLCELAFRVDVSRGRGDRPPPSTRMRDLRTADGLSPRQQPQVSTLL
ncbi:hypothetical protein [Streptomyces flavofungini]|uniref:Uncharacterized protein n=1 Tax=Streptomyces flavofungini TaxID=68200 RepID=A0ABS0X0Q7_9ACTN|nr:hypothetical protein [Streptomyces flavofungini]MBJ3806763.1 hypothetical protein [Streptomyces flavofungini]GHC60683.1 hypothetical protein GCM10010349_30160 [Streptomyces flavofungini]